MVTAGPRGARRASLPLLRASGLAQALPAALAHSPTQARQLVRLLADSEQARLRTFAPCLARRCSRLHIPLPGPLVGRLLALSLSRPVLSCNLV